MRRIGAGRRYAKRNIAILTVTVIPTVAIDLAVGGTNAPQ